MKTLQLAHLQTFVQRLTTTFFVVVAALTASPSTAQTSAQPMLEGKPKIALATFAGGCFWCMEGPFDILPGVISTTSGYMGGMVKKPTYEQVSAGKTGHAEVVQVAYDPSKVSYEQLLAVFWKNIDPTVKNRQFCDSGSHYRSAVFTHSEDQKKAALLSKETLAKNKPFKEDIVTELNDAGEFTAAEDYHQDYYKKNPIRYKYYRNGCGRDARLAELWGAK